MINVQKLRDKLAVKAAEDEKKSAERVNEWDAYLGEIRDEWVNEWGEAWKTAARTILNKIENREVITEKDIPPHSLRPSRDRFYSQPYRFADGRDKPRTLRPPVEVQQLLDALDLIGEDEISHTALAKMGCGSQVMSTVSRYLAGR